MMVTSQRQVFRSTATVLEEQIALQQGKAVHYQEMQSVAMLETVTVTLFSGVA